MTEKNRKWKILDRATVYEKKPWLRIEHQTLELPNGEVVEGYQRLIQPDFAVVYAMTADGRVVVERQYRHGMEDFTLDFPAGLVDEGETPEQACRRELLEETGYRAENWKPLGAYWLHGNYGLCRCHLFKAENAAKIAEPHPDGMEEIETLLMTHNEALGALMRGEIELVASVACMMLAREHLGKEERR